MEGATEKVIDQAMLNTYWIQIILEQCVSKKYKKSYSQTPREKEGESFCISSNNIFMVTIESVWACLKLLSYFEPVANLPSCSINRLSSFLHGLYPRNVT